MDEDLTTAGAPSGGSETDAKDGANGHRLRWVSPPPKGLEFEPASSNSCIVITRNVVRTTVDGEEQVEDSVDVKTDGDFGDVLGGKLSRPRGFGETRREMKSSMFDRPSFGSCDVKDYGGTERETTRSVGGRSEVHRHTFHSTAVRKRETKSSSSVKFSWTATDDGASPAGNGGNCGDAGYDTGVCASRGHIGSGASGVSAESLASPHREFMSRLNEQLGFGEKPRNRPSGHPASFLSTVAAAAETSVGAGAEERRRAEGSRADGEEEADGKRGSTDADGLSGLGPLATTKHTAISIPRLRLMMDSECLYQEYRNQTIVETLLRQRCHDGQGSRELHGRLQKMVAAMMLDESGGEAIGSIRSSGGFSGSGVFRRKHGCSEHSAGSGSTVGSRGSLDSLANSSSSGIGSIASGSPLPERSLLPRDHRLQPGIAGSTTMKGCVEPPAPVCEEPVHPAPSPAETPRRPEKGPVFDFWHALPEVRASGLLSAMSQEQIKLQEAMFELITSEASYMRSLRVATEVFIENPELRELLQSSQRHFLFSNLHEVKMASERMLSELEERLGQSVEISDVCDIVNEHAANNFHCYVKYITNQPYQERALRTLSNETPQFSELLDKLISEPRCKNLPLSSFLLLPFQRITRLKLLVENIRKRAEKGTQRHDNAQKACKQLEMCIKECNDGILKMSRTEQLIHIEKTLEFKNKSVPIISHSRWLYKQGELMEIQYAHSMTLRGNKITFKPLYLFLFTDLLLFARKKDARFLVFEHAELTAVAARQEEPVQNHKHLLILKINLENRKRHKSFILKAQSENEQKRWIAAFTPQQNKTPSELYCFYADCEQVCCIKPYKAQEADELTLDLADSLFILRSTSDGWCKGERVSDRQCGWFPRRVVEPVASENVREENVRERESLLSSVDGGCDGGGGGVPAAVAET